MVFATVEQADGENQAISVFLDDDAAPDQEVATNK